MAGILGRTERSALSRVSSFVDEGELLLRGMEPFLESLNRADAWKAQGKRLCPLGNGHQVEDRGDEEAHAGDGEQEDGGAGGDHPRRGGPYDACVTFECALRRGLLVPIGGVGPPHHSLRDSMRPGFPFPGKSGPAGASGPKVLSRMAFGPFGGRVPCGAVPPTLMLGCDRVVSHMAAGAGWGEGNGESSSCPDA